MKITNLKDIIKRILPLSAVAFFISVIISYDKTKSAIEYILQNNYIHHKMFRLTALHLKKPLLDFVTTLILVDIIVVIFYVSWKFFIAKTVKVKLDFQVLNRQRLKIYFGIAYILVVIYYIYSTFFSENGRASAGINILKLLITAGVLLLLGWALISIKWGRIFKAKNRVYVTGMTAVVILLLFLFTAVIAIYAGMEARPAGPNIILIVVDCLRADHLGCNGYSKKTSPFLDELSRSGILFENAYSNSPWTKPSAASILTGLYPNKHNTVNMTDMLPDGALTLAEILKNHGYYTFFFNGGNANIGEKFNFGQGSDAYISIRKANKLTKSVQTKIANLGKKDKFFAYIHYMDLHLPYHQNPYYDEFLNNEKESFFKSRKILVENIRLYTEKNCLPQGEKDDIIAMYDSQVRFIDNAIKKIAATLKKKNLFNDTLIIVTSDHGEELWDHDNFEHGHTVYNELIHVPLIMAGNGIRHKKMKRPVNLIDLLPTILDTAHIPVNNLSASGKNLLKSSKGPVFSMGTLYGDEKYCLIDGNMKIIQNSGMKRGKKALTGYRSNEKFELYDLETDPFEMYNLRDEKPKIFLKLKKDLQKFKKNQGSLERKKVLLDKESELKEKLKALGYL